MKKFAEKLVYVLKQSPGLTDRELTDILKGRHVHQSQVNQEARLLEGKGVIERIRRPDGKIGNYLTGSEIPVSFPTGVAAARSSVKHADGLSEDILKKHLQSWLEQQGWETSVAWGKKPGVDILGTKNGNFWAIEVKGIGSRNAMRVNYFLAILGETLQRMKDENAKYSIALPDIQQYRNLWSRLPVLAKKRTGITMLFIDHTGHICEVWE